MEQRKAERILCTLYALAAVLCLIIGITSGVTWSHWRWTLDQCIGRNCSCILYGESTPTHFIGGSIYTCIWITFGPVPIILLFGSLGIYHGVRSCIGPATEATRSVLTKNATGETIHMQIRTREIEPVSRVYWIIVSTVSVFFAAYMLAHFALFTDGFLYSCKQYRRELSKLLYLTGTAEGVVHGRLACNAIFDFMDYLQPMVGNIHRGSYVNTAFALIVGIIASFCSTTALSLASVINIKFATKKP